MDEKRWPAIERLLIQKGLLKEWQALWAKHEHQKSGEPLGQILIKAGHLDPVEFALAIAEGFPPQAAPRGLIHAFFPAKGGAGATFLAVNAAVGMAGGGRRVLLLDLNLLLPNAMLYLNAGDLTRTIAACARDRGPATVQDLKDAVHPWGDGLDLLCAPKGVGELVSVTAEQTRAILEVASYCYDHIVIDLPSVHDDACVAALDRADHAIPVFPATVAGIANAIKVTAVLAAIRYPQEKVLPVVNGRRDNDLAESAIAKYLSFPPRAVLPADPARVEASLNRGEPLAKRPGDDPLYLSLAAFVNGIAGRQTMATPAASGFWDRLLRLGAAPVPSAAPAGGAA